jgi:integrase
MRGGLRERSPGVWEVRVERGRDPVTGRRLQKSRTVRGGKREAQRALNALVAEVEEGTSSSSDATFRHVAERWLRLTIADLSPTTLRRYRGLLDQHIYPALGDRASASIRTSELDELHLGLMERKGLSPASVRQVHAVVRRALQQAVRWGWIRTNPATNTTPPRVPPSTIHPPDVAQVLALIQMAETDYPEFGRFLHLAVTTGARRGELCALRWENVDWANETLTIARSVVEVEGGLHESTRPCSSTSHSGSYPPSTAKQQLPAQRHSPMRAARRSPWTASPTPTST